MRNRRRWRLSEAKFGGKPVAGMSPCPISDDEDIAATTNLRGRAFSLHQFTGFILTFLALTRPLHALNAESAAAYSRRTGGEALIVWQRGKILFESYARGGAADRAKNVYSITKSIGALGALAIAGGRRISLDAPVAAQLTEWKNDPRKSRITLRELLDQTSGLAPGYDAIYGRKVRDKNRAALRLPATSPPGKVFAYGPSHYEALEALLERVLQRGPNGPLAVLENGILGLLGAPPEFWRHDPAGNPFFSAGARFTPRDLLKIGCFVERDGRWFIFPLVSPRLFRGIKEGSSANAMYSHGFWLNKNAGKPNARERDAEAALGAGLAPSEWSNSCLSRRAPPDLLAMVGSYGQRVYIVPSRHLVVVRLGRSGGFRDPEFLRALFD